LYAGGRRGRLESALALVFVAAGVLLTARLARRREWLPVAASAVWLALALFWLL
jgi:hypothetical protein